MAKCSLCNEKIPELFLGKLKGTIFRKPGSRKQIPICFQCQKGCSKQEVLSKIS
jgi:hypothetical protein